MSQRNGHVVDAIRTMEHDVRPFLFCLNAIYHVFPTLCCLAIVYSLERSINPRDRIFDDK